MLDNQNPICYAQEMKDRFCPKDLEQITRESLERMPKSQLIHLTLRMRDFGIALYERVNQDSSNSSRPPSSDNPYPKDRSESDEDDIQQADEPMRDGSDGLKEESPAGKTSTSLDMENKTGSKNPGRQPGSVGFWCKDKPVANNREHHHPKRCIICQRALDEAAQPYMAFYSYEIERRPDGLGIVCTLHYYYRSTCLCGHENIQRPGEGFVSVLEGRKRDLKLSEYTMVGPLMAAFIASLSRRSGMSRKKIQELLRSWLSFDLSVGLICKSIREAGIACYPIVDELIDELQKEEIVHLDETPWYQKGVFCWLWVAISRRTAIYRIGSRKKTELLHLIMASFCGWLVTDGYSAYRSYDKRQRCLAHLIRKAVALTGAVGKGAQKSGQWFLRELRGLIKAMARGEDGRKECRPILARLKRACNLGSESDHTKLKALAREILNDWDAVVAFVKNPGLPATNNDAERALRCAVIFRKITFGTRTSEGSRSYAALLTVIETCRLRGIEPWDYVAEAIAKGRKGLAPTPLPH